MQIHRNIYKINESHLFSSTFSFISEDFEPVFINVSIVLKNISIFNVRIDVLEKIFVS